MAISVWVCITVDGPSDFCWRCDRVAAREIDLKGQRDEGVRQREHKVCGDRGAPPPNDELIELQWRVTFGFEVLQSVNLRNSTSAIYPSAYLEVDGKIEGKRKE